jgi:hypothetical protein
MVDHKQKKLGLIILIFLIIFMIIVIDYSKAKPNVIEINSIPSPPKTLENVTIIAGLNNSSRDSINEIRLIAQEYMENLSFPEIYNISLNYSYSCCMDFYEGTFKPIHSNATKIKYHLEILSNGTWYHYNSSYFHMYNNPDEKIINTEENKTPGFEFILIVIVLSILLLTKKKKLDIGK